MVVVAGAKVDQNGIPKALAEMVSRLVIVPPWYGPGTTAQRLVKVVLGQSIMCPEVVTFTHIFLEIMPM